MPLSSIAFSYCRLCPLFFPAECSALDYHGTSRRLFVGLDSGTISVSKHFAMMSNQCFKDICLLLTNPKVNMAEHCLTSHFLNVDVASFRPITCHVHLSTRQK